MWIWALFAVALYVLSVWTGRRLARLSKYKFLMARGIVNADAIDGSSVPLLIAFFHPFWYVIFPCLRNIRFINVN